MNALPDWTGAHLIRAKPKPPAWERQLKATNAEMLEAWTDGLSMAQTGKRHGMSPVAVYKRWKRLGLATSRDERGLS